MEKRICFVISPIGEPGSEIREKADRFLALVKAVGELHNLEVKRGDEVAISADINEDIIEMVQHSDICIVDLSGLNPNVMYEFGMRFQSGLPYIVCASSNTTKLPFDVISKRTIFYGDLEKTAEYMQALQSLRKQIKVYEERNYQTPNVVSLTDVYNLLQNISESINQIKTDTRPYLPSDNTNNDASVDEILQQLSPSEAFRYAYSTNQVGLAEQLLDACRNEPFPMFYNKLCALANIGSDKAAKEVLTILDDRFDSMTMKDIVESIGAVVSCYLRLDSEKDHLDQMDELFEKALGKASSNKERAAILNQKERLYAGAGEFTKAEEIAKKVIDYDDLEPAYFYNYASVLKHTEGKLDEAITNAQKAIAIAPQPEVHQLALVCELLQESNDPGHKVLLEQYMRQLSELSPLKARLVRLQH